MPRWAEVLLTLVLFAVVMAALSWIVRATVPGFDKLLTGALGEWGATLLVTAVIAASGVYAWLGYRKAGGANPNGR